MKRFRIVKDYRYNGDLRAYPLFHQPTYTAWDEVGLVDAEDTVRALDKARRGDYVNVQEEEQSSINSALNYSYVAGIQ